ncbi:MAG TPA: hypothetical protein VJS88_04060, partial [Chthoniobacterales bacterium]|nr:hypothetical protein [Chthoniobacterales bacterium]
AWIQPGDNAEIGGFIIRGREAKKIAVRAIGPSLAGFKVSGVMPDPVLELRDPSDLVAANDNWNSHRSAIIETHLAPNDEHEAVIVTSLAPGSYTGIVRGVNGAGGIGLFELYDLEPSNSRVANISTRARIEWGDKVLVGGFILGGAEPTKVVIRGIGPSLANFGVSGAINNPVLELHDANGGLLSQNDDWRSSQQQELLQSGLAPADDRESAMLMLLDPGAYTAIVRDKNNDAGIGLVEVYNLDAN